MTHMSNELKEPKASPAKVTYHLKQLRKLFLRASDQHFLQMVWAIDALRSGRPEAAAGWLTFPQQAADQLQTQARQLRKGARTLPRR